MNFDAYDIALAALFVLLLWTGVALLRRRSARRSDPYPFRLGQPLDEFQQRWLLVVAAAVGDSYCLSAALPLAEVIVPRPELGRKQQELRRRQLIGQKVDFLLFEPASGEARAAVLLAHNTRDAFREHALLAAGIAVVRIPAEPVLAPAELRLELFGPAGLSPHQGRAADTAEWVLGLADRPPEEGWNLGEEPPAGRSTPDVQPCPRCGAPQRVRRASRGRHAGRDFLVCSRYPDCQQLQPRQ